VPRQPAPVPTRRPASVDATLRQAERLAGSGQRQEAIRLYQSVLRDFPGNRRALEGLRRHASTVAGAVPEKAVRALLDIYNAGRYAEAAAQAGLLAAQFPSAFILHNVIGAANARLGRHEEALAGFDLALQLQPNHVAALHERGNVLKTMGRLDEALVSYDTALRLQPNLAPTHSCRGALLSAQGRHDDAIKAFDEALRHQPNHAEAWNNRGTALAELKRTEAALASFERAVEVAPRYAEAHNNRANALAELGRRDEALQAYAQALQHRPNYAEVHNNRGTALLDMARAEEALAAFEAALQAGMDTAKLHNNRGAALAALNRQTEAIAAYEEALRRDPDYADAWFHRGNALGILKRPDEALEAFRKAHSLKPGFPQAAAQVRNLLAQRCDWAEMPNPAERIEDGDHGRGFAPFVMATMVDDPPRQLACARAWIAKNNPPRPVAPFAKSGRPERLRIGYFSADFEDHATMVLMARMLELHDRSRFEIHAFSYGKPTEDPARRRTLDAVEHFHELSGTSDAAIVDLARGLAIDVAVDLKGFTHDSRYNLFASRLAPVQISYLGYPGTMGAPFIDYIIADSIVLPPWAEPFYDEKVIRLPGSYQVNDNRRATSSRKFTRVELGLPEQGFVFCCFNNTYKLTPAEFDVWMPLLGRVEGSVLWLLDTSERARANLQREASARGIDPNRLVFAPRLSLADHLARHAHADLFLDTFVCNAHTTASDALWSGLPVLTRPGRSFAARVAASLVHAVGLPEMAVDTDADYQALALELATDPARLADIRSRLAANRSTAPLFDSELTTRMIERGYELAFDRWLAGGEPDHIDVIAN